MWVEDVGNYKGGGKIDRRRKKVPPGGSRRGRRITVARNTSHCRPRTHGSFSLCSLSLSDYLSRIHTFASRASYLPKWPLEQIVDVIQRVSLLADLHVLVFVVVPFLVGVLEELLSHLVVVTEAHVVLQVVQLHLRLLVLPPHQEQQQQAAQEQEQEQQPPVREAVVLAEDDRRAANRGNHRDVVRHHRLVLRRRRVLDREVGLAGRAQDQLPRVATVGGDADVVVHEAGACERVDREARLAVRTLGTRLAARRHNGHGTGAALRVVGDADHRVALHARHVHRDVERQALNRAVLARRHLHIVDDLRSLQRHSEAVAAAVRKRDGDLALPAQEDRRRGVHDRELQRLCNVVVLRLAVLRQTSAGLARNHLDSRLALLRREHLLARHGVRERDREHRVHHRVHRRHERRAAQDGERQVSSARRQHFGPRLAVVLRVAHRCRRRLACRERHGRRTRDHGGAGNVVRAARRTGAREQHPRASGEGTAREHDVERAALLRLRLAGARSNGVRRLAAVLRQHKGLCLHARRVQPLGDRPCGAVVRRHADVDDTAVLVHSDAVLRHLVRRAHRLRAREQRAGHVRAAGRRGHNSHRVLTGHRERHLQVEGLARGGRAARNNTVRQRVLRVEEPHVRRVVVRRDGEAGSRIRRPVAHKQLLGGVRRRQRNGRATPLVQVQRLPLTDDRAAVALRRQGSLRRLRDGAVERHVRGPQPGAQVQVVRHLLDLGTGQEQRRARAVAPRHRLERGAILCVAHRHAADHVRHREAGARRTLAQSGTAAPAQGKLHLAAVLAVDGHGEGLTRLAAGARGAERARRHRSEVRHIRAGLSEEVPRRLARPLVAHVRAARRDGGEGRRAAGNDLVRRARGTQRLDLRLPAAVRVADEGKGALRRDGDGGRRARERHTVLRQLLRVAADDESGVTARAHHHLAVDAHRDAGLARRLRHRERVAGVGVRRLVLRCRAVAGRRPADLRAGHRSRKVHHVRCVVLRDRVDEPVRRHRAVDREGVRAADGARCRRDDALVVLAQRHLLVRAAVLQGNRDFGLRVHEGGSVTAHADGASGVEVQHLHHHVRAGRGPAALDVVRRRTHPGRLQREVLAVARRARLDDGPHLGLVREEADVHVLRHLRRHRDGLALLLVRVRRVQKVGRREVDLSGVRDVRDNRRARRVLGGLNLHLPAAVGTARADALLVHRGTVLRIHQQQHRGVVAGGNVRQVDRQRLLRSGHTRAVAVARRHGHRVRHRLAVVLLQCRGGRALVARLAVVLVQAHVAARSDPEVVARAQADAVLAEHGRAVSAAGRRVRALRAGAVRRGEAGVKALVAQLVLHVGRRADCALRSRVARGLRKLPAVHTVARAARGGAACGSLVRRSAVARARGRLAAGALDERVARGTLVAVVARPRRQADVAVLALPVAAALARALGADLRGAAPAVADVGVALDAVGVLEVVVRALGARALVVASVALVTGVARPLVLAVAHAHTLQHLRHAALVAVVRSALRGVAVVLEHAVLVEARRAVPGRGVRGVRGRALSTVLANPLALARASARLLVVGDRGGTEAVARQVVAARHARRVVVVAGGALVAVGAAEARRAEVALARRGVRRLRAAGNVVALRRRLPRGLRRKLVGALAHALSVHHLGLARRDVRVRRAHAVGAVLAVRLRHDVKAVVAVRARVALASRRVYHVVGAHLALLTAPREGTVAHALVARHSGRLGVAVAEGGIARNARREAERAGSAPVASRLVVQVRALVAHLTLPHVHALAARALRVRGTLDNRRRAVGADAERTRLAHALRRVARVARRALVAVLAAEVRRADVAAVTRPAVEAAHAEARTLDHGVDTVLVAPVVRALAAVGVVRRVARGARVALRAGELRRTRVARSLARARRLPHVGTRAVARKLVVRQRRRRGVSVAPAVGRHRIALEAVRVRRRRVGGGGARVARLAGAVRGGARLAAVARPRSLRVVTLAHAHSGRRVDGCGAVATAVRSVTRDARREADAAGGARVALAVLLELRVAVGARDAAPLVGALARARETALGLSVVVAEGRVADGAVGVAACVALSARRALAGGVQRVRRRADIARVAGPAERAVADARVKLLVRRRTVGVSVAEVVHAAQHARRVLHAPGAARRTRGTAELLRALQAARLRSPVGTGVALTAAVELIRARNEADRLAVSAALLALAVARVAHHLAEQVRVVLAAAVRGVTLDAHRGLRRRRVVAEVARGARVALARALVKALLALVAVGSLPRVHVARALARGSVRRNSGVTAGVALCGVAHLAVGVAEVAVRTRLAVGTVHRRVTLVALVAVPLAEAVDAAADGLRSNGEVQAEVDLRVHLRCAVHAALGSTLDARLARKRLRRVAEVAQGTLVAEVIALVVRLVAHFAVRARPSHLARAHARLAVHRRGTVGRAVAESVDARAVELGRGGAGNRRVALRARRLDETSGALRARREVRAGRSPLAVALAVAASLRGGEGVGAVSVAARRARRVVGVLAADALRARLRVELARAHVARLPLGRRSARRTLPLSLALAQALGLVGVRLHGVGVALAVHLQVAQRARRGGDAALSANLALVAELLVLRRAHAAVRTRPLVGARAHAFRLVRVRGHAGGVSAAVNVHVARRADRVGHVARRARLAPSSRVVLRRARLAGGPLPLVQAVARALRRRGAVRGDRLSVRVAAAVGERAKLARLRARRLLVAERAHGAVGSGEPVRARLTLAAGPLVAARAVAAGVAGVVHHRRGVARAVRVNSAGTADRVRVVVVRTLVARRTREVVRALLAAVARPLVVALAHALRLQAVGAHRRRVALAVRRNGALHTRRVVDVSVGARTTVLRLVEDRRAHVALVALPLVRARAHALLRSHIRHDSGRVVGAVSLTRALRARRVVDAAVSTLVAEPAAVLRRAHGAVAALELVAARAHTLLERSVRRHAVGVTLAVLKDVALPARRESDVANAALVTVLRGVGLNRARLALRAHPDVTAVAQALGTLVVGDDAHTRGKRVVGAVHRHIARRARRVVD
eukprot:Rhum_TRINITY_DN13928_c1_g3::Rhum_TRINITY_DN13928_c1_g3_i2::g.65491::m.65491